MKQWIGLLAVVLFGGSIFAAPVDAETAKRVAFAFAKQNLILASHTEGVGEATTWENVWVVPLKPSGYVVVEKDDSRPPVIAFDKGDFPEGDLPPAMAALLARPAVEEGLTTLSTLSATPAHEEWEMLLSPSSGLETLADKEPPTDVPYREIEDFTYLWNQCLPYNLYAPGLSRERVPYDAIITPDRDELLASLESAYGLRSACGCVATAMSQVGAWFQWPYVLRGVTSCEHMDNKDKAEKDDLANRVYATYQVATPGKPYNWEVLNAATAPTGVEDEASGEEVGRFMQHWATVCDTDYFMDVTGGACPTNTRPDLLLLCGYKVVSPECVGNIMVVSPDEPGTWVTDGKKTYTPAQFKALYGAFEKAIWTYEVPTPTGISGHYIVCSGWAKKVDTVLTKSEDVYYAKLNYGWGPLAAFSGWYTLRRVHNEGDGEEIATDGMVFLQETFTILPLQCGEIVNLSEVAPMPQTLEWYEAPYWSKKYPAEDIKRQLQVVTFTEESSVKRSLSLAAAVKSDANWIYTPEEENPSDETGTLAMEQQRGGLKTAVLFPELLKRGPENEKLSIAVGLERLTYQKSSTDSNGEVTVTSEFVPDDLARDLLVALEDVKTGKIFYKHKLSLNKTKDEGRCTVTIPEEMVPAGTVFRVLLIADESPLDTAPIAISVDSLAYVVKGVTVKGSYSSTKTTYDFASVTNATTVGALTSGMLSAEQVKTLNATTDKELWLAVTIDTGTLTHDALWKPLTIASTEDAVVLPTIAFEKSRLFLNNLNTPIAFTTTGEIKSVKVYSSQGSWLNKASRNGFELTADEIKAGTFTLANRANTDKTKPEAAGEDAMTPDAMTLDSAETVGRDTVLSLCATDKVGNVAWTHVRLTWGYSDGIIELLTDPDRKSVTLYLDHLLYAALYAGCYEWGSNMKGLPVLKPKRNAEPTGENATTGELTAAHFAAAMDFVEDTIHFGYATEGNTLSKNLFTYMLLNAEAANPRVEILSVSPTEITFQMSIDTPKTSETPSKPATSTTAEVPTAPTSSATLAQYVDPSAITIEGGETLDEMAKLLPADVELTRNSESGTYTLKVPTGKKFFQMKL